MNIGQKIGSLTIVNLIGSKAECLCACGGKILLSETELKSHKNCGLCYLRKRTPYHKGGARDEMYTDEYKVWRKRVFSRYRYRCFCCTDNSHLNAHHLNSWDWSILERYDVNNGVCLCKNCHENFHNMYGRGKNTREQFQTFAIIYYGKDLE